MYLHRIFSIILIGMIALMSSTSYAEEALTKENIKRFYKQATEIQLLSTKINIDFLNEHIHEDANVILHMISNMQGMPPQKQTVTYNKTELIKATKDGKKMSDIKKVENNILAIDISTDGRSAKVKNSTFSVLTMSISTPNGALQLYAEQSMLCDDAVVLGLNGVIQAKDGECSVEINMRPIK